MGFVPLALSVHKFITSVGADAGFAALVAVAILVLLYFAHARETAGLRSHIAELLERVSELETALARVAANQARLVPAPAPSMRTPAARPAPAQAAPAVASAGSRLAALELPPGPPAGVGAPALSSATRVIPAAVAARIAAARVAVAAGSVAAAGAGGGSGGPPASGDELGSPPTALAPATPAGGQVSIPAGSNGASAHSPAPSTLTPAASAAPATPDPAAPAPARSAPGAPAPAPPAPVRAQGGPADRQPSARPVGSGQAAGAAASRRVAGRAASAPPLERTAPRRESGSRVPRSVLVGLAVLIVAGVVVAAVLLSQSTGSNTHASNSTRSNGNASTAGHNARTPAVVRVNPANVTVAILNGTTVNKLAHKVAAKLVPPYREGTLGDAPDQTHATTIVAYLPGHRAAALAVAKALGLAAKAVQPVDQSTQSVACAGATACTTDVVVTVGSDLSSL